MKQVSIYYCITLIMCLGSYSFTTTSEHDLVDVAAFIPGIRTHIYYATNNNFAKKQVYPEAGCYLRRATAEKLAKVQKELHEMGLGLLIWDGYRPLSIQRIFWNLVPDDRYVANPAKGSRHNRGAAVDLTLVTSDGKPIEMPTEFDNFTERAHRDYNNLPAQVLKMRALLEQVMTKHGFVGVPTEWWHFDDADWQKYDLMDISFVELKGKQ